MMMKSVSSVTGQKLRQRMEKLPVCLCFLLPFDLLINLFHFFQRRLRHFFAASLNGSFNRTEAALEFLVAGTQSFFGIDVPSAGDATIEQVARDVLGLTKLNYNACKLG
ncbi:hypothetical protein, partial [Planctopirus hydrillae]|uniref:hypothetical protein n=1 Tax=Planctopirus hydrillae TaxID=1841610 RepID=UPI0013F4C858